MSTQHSVLHGRQKESPESPSGKELKCPHLEEKEGKAQAGKWLERRKG